MLHRYCKLCGEPVKLGGAGFQHRTDRGCEMVQLGVDDVGEQETDAPGPEMGRPVKPLDEVLIPVTIRLTAEEARKLRALGRKWLRPKLARVEVAA
jgi:hypothetical protein